MEKFVDRIIETDRKARAIIEQAQSEVNQLAAGAEERAAKGLAERAAQNEASIAALDKRLAAREARAMKRADEDYIRLKHGLDADFALGHDAWLSEILTACTKL